MAARSTTSPRACGRSRWSVHKRVRIWGVGSQGRRPTRAPRLVISRAPFSSRTTYDVRTRARFGGFSASILPRAGDASRKNRRAHASTDRRAQASTNRHAHARLIGPCHAGDRRAHASSDRHGHAGASPGRAPPIAPPNIPPPNHPIGPRNLTLRVVV